MSAPPAQLDGANVLLWTDEVFRARATGRTTRRVDGVVLGPAESLAICQYEGDGEYYLFYCDPEWNVRTDTCHATLELAREQAEVEYEGIGATWRGLSE